MNELCITKDFVYLGMENPWYQQSQVNYTLYLAEIEFEAEIKNKENKKKWGKKLDRKVVMTDVVLFGI